MDPQGGDPAAPTLSLGGAETLSAWPEDADSPAEARWRRSHIVGRYEDFLRCSVDWLWETDADLVLTFVSSPVALKLGLPAEFLIGRPILSLGYFRSPDSPDSSNSSGPEPPGRGPLGHLRPFREVPFVMTGADARKVTYLLSGVPYFSNEDARFAGFRGTAVAAESRQPKSGQSKSGQAADSLAATPAEAPVGAPVDAQATELAALSQALEEALLSNADLTWRLARIEKEQPATQVQTPATVHAPEPAGPAEAVQSERQMDTQAESSRQASLRRTAHELRTPLNAVMGYADLGLSEVFGPLGDRYLDCFRTIKEAGRHMDDLVAELQTAGRRAEKSDLAVEIVELAAVVAKAKAMIALAARNAGIDISRIGPMAGGQVVGDERACVQIILNLLSNAVKFTPPGGSVGLETIAGPNGTLQIVVWDSGAGISLEEQPKIFDPDYRAEGVRAAAKIPGQGLGLAISRDLARTMGGDLSVISQPGQGSRFILSLPLARAASNS